MSNSGPKLDPADAIDLIDDDLPDGAYFAMLEEMTGMEPAEALVAASEEQAKLKKRRRRRKRSKKGNRR